MLILTRKRGERIRIGEDVQVVVTQMRRGMVRLGIMAPPGVPVFREEVYQAILEENRRAAQPSTRRLQALERALARR